MTGSAPERASFGLRPNILSQWETLAQSLSSIAPTAAPAMIIPLVIAASGRSAWLAFVVATVVVLDAGKVPRLPCDTQAPASITVMASTSRSSTGPRLPTDAG